MEDLSESIWSLAHQPIKTYIRYHNAYDHQIWLGGDLPWGASDHLITWSFETA